MEKEYYEVRIPRFANRSFLQLLFVLFLISLSFMAGSYYTKLRYLELGGAAKAAPANIQEALTAYAKQLDLDTKQFQSCLNNKIHLAKVDADMQEGMNFGVNATPGFFINGMFLSGAYPYETFKEIIDKILAGTATQNYLDYSQMLQDANQNPNGKGFDPVPKDVPLGKIAARGGNNAKVTIIEYSDFQCPFSARAFPTMNRIRQEYKDKVRFVFKQYPLTSIHPNAQITALASECANEQNKFWEYHDLLFTNQQQWTNLQQAITES